MMPGD